MSSALLSRASAFILGVAGTLLLFAADLVLPQMIPGFPESGIWVGQLLGAAWLGFAALNWYSRTQLLGGIYGRPIVFANFVHWFVAASALFSPARGPEASTTLTAVAIVVTLLAGGYGALVFKGPFQTDLRRHGME